MRIIVPEDPSILQTCLDCLPFFDTFSSEEKHDLLDYGADLITYDTGEFLIQEGGMDQVLFFLLSGAASVVKEGASIPIAELQPGDFFGEMAFLTGQSRTSNVIVHHAFTSKTGGSTSVLSEKICSILSPNDPAPTIILRFNRPLLTHIQQKTRIRIKDQIIAVLVVRMENISEKVEDRGGEVPEFSIDPELERLLEESSESELENAKDQIIKHLVAFIVQLNETLTGSD